MTATLTAQSPLTAPVLVPVEPTVPDAQLTLDELGSRIVGLAGRLAAATCQWLLLVAAFDARRGFDRFGLASTARWLTHCCGLSHRTAVEHVRVARALISFPDLAAAMSTGRLAYSHARAIARLARDGEAQLVADLIEVAEGGTVGQLETVVRGLRSVHDVEDSGEDPPEEYLRRSWTPASQWALSARLDPERGALIDKALDRLVAAEGIAQTEALERLAEIALAVLADSGAGPQLRADERAAVVVHLDARRTEPTPARSAGRNLPPAHLEDGPGLPDEVVERLLCDGRVRTSVHDGNGTLVDLGRTHRVVTRKLFRALLDRDRGCAHPGCHSRVGLEAHHVRHWIHGGRTDLANLILLCRPHHHAHHDSEFSIGVLGSGVGSGSFIFRRADGRVLEKHVDPARLMPYAPDLCGPGADADLDDGDRDDGNHGGHRGARPPWTGTGQRLDRTYAISLLAVRREGCRSAA